MMNSSAGVPTVASGSASSAGGTWPCGETSGRSSTRAYSSRATALDRVSGEAAVWRERPWGAGRHGLFLLVAIMRRIHPYTQNSRKTYAAILGWRAGEDAIHVEAVDPHRALHGGEILARRHLEVTAEIVRLSCKQSWLERSTRTAASRCG